MFQSYYFFRMCQNQRILSAGVCGRLIWRNINPSIPLRREPIIIPNLAFSSNEWSMGDGNERLAIKRDTVNPIPPNIDTEANDFHVIF